MEKNKMDQHLDNIMNVIGKLHPQEQNALLAQVVDMVMSSRWETVKTHRDQAEVLTRANDNLRTILKMEGSK